MKVNDENIGSSINKNDSLVIQPNAGDRHKEKYPTDKQHFCNDNVILENKKIVIRDELREYEKTINTADSSQNTCVCAKCPREDSQICAYTPEKKEASDRMIDEWARHPCCGSICRGQNSCTCTCSGREGKHLCTCRPEKWVPTYRKFGVWARHPCCGSICRGWSDRQMLNNGSCDCHQQPDLYYPHSKN